MTAATKIPTWKKLVVSGASVFAGVALYLYLRRSLDWNPLLAFPLAFVVIVAVFWVVGRLLGLKPKWGGWE